MTKAKAASFARVGVGDIQEGVRRLRVLVDELENTDREDDIVRGALYSGVRELLEMIESDATPRQEIAA